MSLSAQARAVYGGMGRPASINSSFRVCFSQGVNGVMSSLPSSVIVEGEVLGASEARSSSVMEEGRGGWIWKGALNKLGGARI